MYPSMITSFLESIFIRTSPYISAISDYIRKRYCKTAIGFYDPYKIRTLEIPIEDSLTNILNGSDSEDDFEFADELCDMMSTEYKLVTLQSIDPEVYYFFKFFDSQSTEVFKETVEYWGLELRKKYYLCINDGNVLTLNTDRDELYCNVQAGTYAAC